MSDAMKKVDSALCRLGVHKKVQVKEDRPLGQSTYQGEKPVYVKVVVAERCTLCKKEWPIEHV